MTPFRALGELIAEARPGFASGARDAGGLAQVRMNNVTTLGQWDWSRLIRLPLSPDEVPEYLVRPGDVLFNNTNSTELVGKAAYFEGFSEPIAFSNHFTRLRTRPELDARYLALWLTAQWQSGVFARLCDRWVGQSAVNYSRLAALRIPVPSIQDQRRIVSDLAADFEAIEGMVAALEAQSNAARALVDAALRGSLDGERTPTLIGEVTNEITAGVGVDWARYRQVGASRGGLIPPKEPIGKDPGRYKLVAPGTTFYNPMRILLGSIAFVDIDGEPGIASPDYVVIRSDERRLDPLWFYIWLRSSAGERLIKSLARGAVRERLLYRRLAVGIFDLPSIAAQHRATALIRSAGHVQRSTAMSLADASALRRAALAEIFGNT